MARVIQAIRSYPITLVLAGLCFLLSLALATASVGKILGGDDEGSGMGGTGAPVPFFGANDEPEPEMPLERSDRNDADALPEWLPFQLRMLETVDIPRPDNSIEDLVRRSAPAPEQDHIGEPLTPAQRMMYDLADSAARDQVETVLELNIQVEDINPLRNINERLSLPQLATPRLAEQEADPGLALELEPLPEQDAAERAARERIQRPELPPFQRMRPPQRASIAAPRPQPMRM